LIVENDAEEKMVEGILTRLHSKTIIVLQLWCGTCIWPGWNQCSPCDQAPKKYSRIQCVIWLYNTPLSLLFGL